MIKKRTLILSCIFSLISGCVIGGVFTFYYYIYNFKNAADFMSSMYFESAYGQCSSFHTERAYDAYRNKDPQIGIWAIEGTIKEYHELILPREPSEIVYTKQVVAFDLMIFHARLAKLYSQISNTKKHQINVAKAVQFAKTAFPNKNQPNLKIDSFSEIEKIIENIDKSNT